MDRQLASLTIRGFRSIRDLSLELGPINVLIGANGSGKSNFLAVLELLPMLRTQSLQRFVRAAGGASTLLHYGPKLTPEMTLRAEFEQDGHRNAYCAQLAPAADDSLFFGSEDVMLLAPDDEQWRTFNLGTNHGESRLVDAASSSHAAATRTVNWWLAKMNFFHFHDTSIHSALRTNARSTQHQYLRSAGDNLAAYLLWLSQAAERNARVAWKRINLLVRQVAPFIKQLAPTPLGVVDPASFDIASADDTAIRLNWVDQNDALFGPHQLSDGTLRAIALITALAQPSETLPAIISIDEPELGLHPAALGVLAALIRSASTRCQVVVATQSPTLLDHFNPDEVLVTENRGGETSIRRLDVDELSSWTEDYKLSELFDMNILEGRP